MDLAIFNAFADELAKEATAAALMRDSSASFKALDRAKQMAGAGAGGITRSIPKPGSFGIKTVKSASEKMDRESWKQTAKDMPAVILGTGLGYGVGKTVAEEVGRRVNRGGVQPAWVKHAPLASAMASSLASYSLGRTRAGLKKRRDAAREKAKT